LHEQPSESKTPETELHNNIQLEISGKAMKINKASESVLDDDEFKSAQYSLSTRATQIKHAINKQETVKAVVLSPDGSASEISYSTNSAQARKILSGRPTIIGQLEEIGVVMVRCSDQSECGPANKNVLPAPFCNASYNGNILLFAVDSKGFSADFSLSDYEKYSKEKASETAKAQKEFDGAQISIKSALGSPFSYDLTKVFIQSEIDKKSKTAKLSMKESAAALVEEMLSLDSSPMNDPDYAPEELEESEAESEETSEGAGDWRAQLQDALECVRERGHADGEYLAERISATFYELNGVEPSFAELQSIFHGIEQDLANEAEEDIESGRSYDAQRLAEHLASSMSENPDATDLVEYSMRIVGMDLVSRAKAAYSSINGKQPSKGALRRSVHKLALKLAEQAIAASAKEAKSAKSDVYDPHNIDDQVLAKIDEIESEQFDADHFNLKMLTTASASKKGKYEAYAVYFSNFDKETERKNLGKAIESFEMRNRRSPSSAEVEGIKAFLSTSKDTKLVQFKLSVISDEEEKDAKKNEKLLVTPVKKKKSAARFNVYFDDKSLDQSAETALKWFERFNSRKPTSLEMSGIESFLQTDKSELIECEFEVSAFDMSKAEEDDSFDDDSKEAEEDLLKMRTSKAVKKKTSTTYTLDFADTTTRESGDAKQALKWFERFNSREANKEERARIAAFVKADNEQIIDID